MHIFLDEALANLQVFDEFHLISFLSWISKMRRERTCNAKPYSFFWDPQEARKGGGRWQIALEWVEQGRGVGVPWGTSVIGTDPVTFARIRDKDKRKLGSHQLLAKSHSLLAHIIATISTTLILHFLTESCRPFICSSCPIIMVFIISLGAATCWGATVDRELGERWQKLIWLRPKLPPQDK